MEGFNFLSLSKLKENLEMQLSEIEMLQSVYCNPGEFRLEDPTALIEIQNFLSNKVSYTPPMIDFSVNLTISELKFEVSVNLSHEYPDVEPDIYVRNDKLCKTSHSKLNKELNDFISDYEKGTPCIFNAITWLQDNADKYIELRPETTKKETVNDEKLVRMWLYSHHIYSKSKRREILVQAELLKLTGFCLPGKPGIICVEGPASDCNEWWQIIRNMGWKKLFVKITEDSSDSPETFSKFKTFEEIVFQTSNLKCQHMDLGEFYKFLEDHQCEYIFKDLFGVDNNKKNGS